MYFAFDLPHLPMPLRSLSCGTKSFKGWLQSDLDERIRAIKAAVYIISGGRENEGSLGTFGFPFGNTGL